MVGFRTNEAAGTCLSNRNKKSRPRTLKKWLLFHVTRTHSNLSPLPPRQPNHKIGLE